MKIRFLESTQGDLIWMRHYYEKIFPQGAQAAANHYKITKLLIKENPYIGRSMDWPSDVRTFPISKTPFSFIYRITDDAIEVLRIWDGRQNGQSLIY